MVNIREYVVHYYSYREYMVILDGFDFTVVVGLVADLVGLDCSLICYSFWC